MATSRDWQCGKSLTECLDYMLKSNITTDVTFHVGAERKVVHAHKFILISRSPVFYAMLEGPMSEKGEITIPDINEKTFNIFLRYLYTDQIQFDLYNVISVKAAARKYCVDRLVQECDALMENIVTLENAGVLLEEAHLYMEEDVKMKCLQIIEENPDEFLKSDNFGYLCADCVKSITESDDLVVEEESVYEAVLRWSEGECIRQGLEGTDENQRKVLGEILFTVRFPLIQKDYFTNEICARDILTHAEVMTAIRLQTGKGNVLCDYLQTKKRKTERVIRFYNIHATNWFNTGRLVTDVLSFKVSRNVTLHGICIYSKTDGTQTEINNVILYDENGQVLYKNAHNVIPSEEITDVPFDTKICLKHSHPYTLLLHIALSNCQPYGEKGKTFMTVKSTMVEFFDIERMTFSFPILGFVANNGFRGPVAGLLFSGL